ncbi:MAG: glutamate-5-semialdehyde dehydrogenase [Bdellovibrionales bacterium]|nr:glutamate-5-semialdehyde dehydrogenase [Bdellovibrionales bacterium]
MKRKPAKKRSKEKSAPKAKAAGSVRRQLVAARAAALRLSALPASARARALARFAELLREREPALLEANARDLAAQKGRIPEAMYERLKLDAAKLRPLIEGINELSRAPDALGRRLEHRQLDDGLVLEKVAVPLGVVAVIFESRPDALPQIASLALKSGNAVVLKGGREALNSNRAMMKVLEELRAAVPELPEGFASLVESREAVHELLGHPELVDLVIPRGSGALVRSIQESTRIPVLGHAEGVCHLFVHASADLAQARKIAIDSKCQYPSACNSLETLLVDRAVAPAFLEFFAREAIGKGVELRACPESRKLLAAKGVRVKPAKPSDFGQEFGALVLALRVVGGLDEALAHIAEHGSRHTDAIAARDSAALARFFEGVDSACVLANASTRFADGYRFGLGAEVGVSTAKTHARGPVGAEGLMTYQWRLRGTGQVVEEYVGEGARGFQHRDLPLKG